MAASYAQRAHVSVHIKADHYRYLKAIALIATHMYAVQSYNVSKYVVFFGRDEYK